MINYEYQIGSGSWFPLDTNSRMNPALDALDWPFESSTNTVNGTAYRVRKTNFVTRTATGAIIGTPTPDIIKFLVAHPDFTVHHKSGWISGAE